MPPIGRSPFSARGWRSIYVRDPEENTVELVCFDESVRES
jgi:hypothetical protein